MIFKNKQSYSLRFIYFLPCHGIEKRSESIFLTLLISGYFFARVPRSSFSDRMPTLALLFLISARLIFPVISHIACAMIMHWLTYVFVSFKEPLKCDNLWSRSRCQSTLNTSYNQRYRGRTQYSLFYQNSYAGFYVRARLF